VRFGSNSILALLLFGFLCSPLHAADDSNPLPADSLLIKCARAQLWDQDKISVAELTGPVNLELDHTKMSADNAVVWIGPNPGGPVNSHRVQISLIGRAQLQQAGVLRLDRRLFVTAVVSGDLKLIGERASGADESSPLYQDAAAVREGKPSTTNPATLPTITPAPVEPALGGISPLPPLVPSTAPTTEPISTVPWPTVTPPVLPTTQPIGGAPVTGPRLMEFDGDYERTVTPDGTIAAVCTNGVSLRYRDQQQNLLEFTARSMVLFTNLKQFKGAGEGENARQFIADHIVSAYFEGDVQVYMTPLNGMRNELRMRAERVYYEFDTDRAFMTDVLFHTVDLKKGVPMFMRAQKLRQLSSGEFKMENVEFSSSAFFTPSYGIGASNIYVRAEDSGDPTVGEKVNFVADNATLNVFGVPAFYFPSMGGEMNTKGSAFQNIDIVDDSDFGDGVRTRWGLFESLGIVPPKDTEFNYDLDYLSKRGPGVGLNGIYTGGFVSDSTRQPWDFTGDFRGYMIDDHGTDDLGAARQEETPDNTLRGRIYFEHEFFFPDGWLAQARLGYVSDSNFMDQYFNAEYQNNLPVDDSIFVKHSSDSEVFSFLAEAQPNRAISSADEEEENREISRLPEVSYQRIGDSVAGDHLTFFSENSASALKFVSNEQSLSQQGFYPQVEPGLPAYAYTGDPGKTTLRGDFREEMDWPINAGVFKVVPYAFARYTPYSQGVVPPGVEPQIKSIPTDVVISGDRNRVMTGVGARFVTSFWKTDNTVESDMFDIHRIRHIIEPELNLFVSTSNVSPQEVYVYDPQVDGVSDIKAAQLALRQRWETKRGGPGRWRNVDFFDLNLYGNFFGNQSVNRFRYPTDFRGLFFYSTPEASQARNSANADATWRLSDTTALLSDVEQNLDKYRLATAAMGIAVQRDVRLSYYLGIRYIADLNSNVATIQINYQLDRKYSLSGIQSFDLAQNKDVYYGLSLIRSFDNFSISARIFYDQSTNDKGFSFSVQPFGAKSALGSDRLAQPPAQ
jgi:hypothetical protein